MEKLWQDEAWEAYLCRQTQDKKILEKINRLIRKAFPVRDGEGGPLAVEGAPVTCVTDLPNRA